MTALLGVTTIVGFGVWFYGFGVYLEPLRADTGWSEAALTGIYGASLLAGGALAAVVGRALHRHGPRRVYLAGALTVGPAYLAAASADQLATFAVAAGAAGAVTAALGHYAAVHTVLAQLVPPAGRTRAITSNTLWGAFASPLALPALAWLVLQVGWRPTLQLIGVVLTVTFAAVAVVIPDGGSPEDEHVPLRDAWRLVTRDPVVVALLATTFAGGLATSVVIVYQVPVMVAGGLSLTLASSLAGARGLLQLAGRLPLPWLVARLGSRTTLQLSHALTAASCVLLLGAGRVPTAVLFAVVAGVAIGALVPVESVFTADAVADRDLGTILGVSSLTRGLGAALGPAAGGALASATGTRVLPLLLAGAAALAAAAVVPRAPRRS